MLITFAIRMSNTHTHILPTENEMKRTEIIIRPLKKKKSKKPANGNDLT